MKNLKFIKNRVLILLLIVTPHCTSNVHYGMYTLFVHYTSSRIDKNNIECKIVSPIGETVLLFEKEDVFTNLFSFPKDSIFVSQYTARNYDKILGQNVWLQFKYGANSTWISFDSQFINEEELINSDIYFGKKVLPFGDSSSQYISYENNFNNVTDTLYIKKTHY